MSFIVWYLTSVWLYLRSSCEGNDDDTAMSTVWDERAATCSSNLGSVVPSSRGGDNLLGDGCGLTCLGQTDAQCGFSCHRSGNVGYQEPRGGAKVAPYLGGGEQMGLCGPMGFSVDAVWHHQVRESGVGVFTIIFHLTALITSSRLLSRNEKEE